MKVAPGDGDAYVQMERGLWKPIHETRRQQGIGSCGKALHEARIADDLMRGWQLQALVLPAGETMACSFAPTGQGSAAPI